MSGGVRFEDTMPEELDVTPLSDRAFRLWVYATCYCSRARAGDVLSPLTLKGLGRPRTATQAIPIRELCDAGLIERVADGYRILGPWRVVPHRWIPKWLRAAVVERDGYVCQLCGGGVEPSDLHIDHVTPVVLGGGESLDNLQVAHASCNISKGGRR